MTHVSFNSYASKIFENHPLAVWGLDDNLHYLSALGTEEEGGYRKRDFYNWATENCIVSPIVNGYPNGLSHEFNVSGRLYPSASKTSCTLFLNGSATWNDYIQDKNYKWFDLNTEFNTWQEVLENAPSVEILKDAYRKSICISFFASFLGNAELNIDSIDININYINSLTEKPEKQTVNFPIIKNFDNWKKILGTFDMTNVNQGFLLSITLNFKEATSGFEDIWLAGFNIGYWSEIFCHEFNGIVPLHIPSELENIIGPGLCARVSSVFTSDDDGYALIDEGRLLAMHDGLPLVYGSINQTCLYYPSIDGLPSLVLPSKGFLTQNGKYNDATLEFWMRIDNKSQTPFKIFGTFNSTDGLYVEKGFLTLKVGTKYASHYVGKWYRPMLISFRYSLTKVSMLINGEQVISLTIDNNDVDLLSENEYLAFFCHESTFPFEIDCIAIYPYYQSIEVAKKNFIYGQIVQKTNIIDQSYIGDTVHFDFAFSKYDIDFKIPDSIKWNTGIFTNVFVNDTFISIPSFSLPDIVINNLDGTSAMSKDEWSVNLASLLSDDTDYIHFNNLTNDQYGYLYYSTFSQLNELIKMFYIDITVNGDGPIAIFKDKITKSYLKIYIDGATHIPSDSKIVFSFSNNGDEEQILYSHYIDRYSRKKVGFNIEKFMSFYSRNINGFLNSQQPIEVYIGGFNGESLDGYIHNVNFNGSEYSKLFINQENGFFMSDPDEFISNNQLCFFKENNKMKMDINISGYWRTSVPLAFFAKYVKDTSGQKFYDLDLLQLNCESVTPQDGEYENAEIKTYITFQRNDIGVKSIFDFTYSDIINNVIHLDNQDWENTKYHFVDGSVVYHPKTEYVQKLLVGLHVKFDVKKAISKSIAFKRLEITSICFDVDKPYKIGTRYGKNVYPIAKSGDSIISKTINPFLITKDSLSYLYLTKTSGIQILNEDVDYERGICIPINEDKAPDFRLGAVRLWLRYNDKEFSNAPKKIFEINAKNIKYYAYLVKDFDNERAKIIIYNSETNSEINNIKYIQEDIEVTNPILTTERWTSISIMFGDSVDISEIEGSIILFSGANFQNIGLYENSNEAIYNLITSDIWADLISLDWNDIKDETWTQIYNRKSVQSFFVDMIPIYRSLIGTQSEKIDDEKYAVTTKQSNVKIYNDIEVKNFVLRKAEPYTVR